MLYLRCWLRPAAKPACRQPACSTDQLYRRRQARCGRVSVWCTPTWRPKSWVGQLHSAPPTAGQLMPSSQPASQHTAPTLAGSSAAWVPCLRSCAVSACRAEGKMGTCNADDPWQALDEGGQLARQAAHCAATRHAAQAGGTLAAAGCCPGLRRSRSCLPVLGEAGASGCCCHGRRCHLLSAQWRAAGGSQHAGRGTTRCMHSCCWSTPDPSQTTAPLRPERGQRPQRKKQQRAGTGSYLEPSQSLSCNRGRGRRLARVHISAGPANGQRGAQQLHLQECNGGEGSPRVAREQLVQSRARQVCWPELLGHMSKCGNTQAFALACSSTTRLP